MLHVEIFGKEKAEILPNGIQMVREGLNELKMDHHESPSINRWYYAPVTVLFTKKFRYRNILQNMRWDNVINHRITAFFGRIILGVFKE